MFKINNKNVMDVFNNCNGVPKNIHKVLCELGKVNPSSIIVGSIYNKAKRTIHHIKRLKNCRNISKLNLYLNKEFVFPRRNLKRKNDESMEEMKNKCKLLKTSIEIHEKTNSQLREKIKNINISRLNQKIKRQSTTIRRQTDIIAELREKLKNALEKDTNHKETQCNSFSYIMNKLRVENDDLKCQLEEGEINTTSKNEFFNTRDSSKGRPFNSKIREIYYQFRSRGIGLQHCAPLINHILNVFDIEAGDLPSKTTAVNITSELGLIAKQHVTEVIDNSDNITLHRDATTKLGRHFYGLNISTDKKENFITGLHEVKDGKAVTYADCTKNVLKDLTNISKSEFDISNKVKNFMTDRSATENKTNALLSQDLSCHPVHSYKCAIHPLLQFSDICEKQIHDLESSFQIKLNKLDKFDTFGKSLLRSVSKLFFKDSTGDPLLTAIYLKQQHGITSLPIWNFRGNRFNTLFHNSRGTFFLATYIVNYLKTSKSSLNSVQDFILHGLQNHQLLCIYRALGILCYIFTEPYWTVAANKDLSPLDMGNIYKEIVKLLEMCKNNPELLLRNEIKLLQGPELEPKPESAYLFNCDSSFDKETLICLKQFVSSLLDKSKKLFQEFLEGGPLCEPSETTRADSISCPPNNICVERLFGSLDNKLHQGPKYTIENIEATVMFNSNKTGEWLSNKPENEKIALIDHARKERKDYQEVCKGRQEKLLNDRSAIIDDKIRMKKENDEKKQAKKSEVLKNIAEIGIWQNLNEINSELALLTSKKDKIAALKKQLTIHKETMSISTNQKYLLQFSSKGKIHDIEKLISNLLQLLRIRQCDMDIFQEPDSFIGKTITHIWTDEITKMDTKYTGKILSFSENIFKVKYLEGENADSEDIYELNITEFISDYKEGNLYFCE